MKDIEKNDVDINKLFKWGASMDLATPQGNLVVWMRVLGDADVNRARIYALRRSAEMRAKMLDIDSDERVALIPVLDTSSKTKVVELMLTLRIREITEIATQGLEIVYPKDLASTASLEEQEKHQAVIDNFPSYIEKLTKKAINKEVAKERRRLNKMSVEELEELYTSTLIEHACETEMYQAFQDKTTCFACFKDENYVLPLFVSFEDYLDLPTEVKITLSDFYGTLSIDVDSLKKSPEVVL